MAWSLSSITGSDVGRVLLVLIVAGLLWYWLHYKKLSNKNSEIGSSDPSALVEWNMGGSVSMGGRTLYGPEGARQFKLEELDQATKQFSETNLIRGGSFGLCYKGLLHDGTLAVVKRQSGAPHQLFVEEVCYLVDIQHRNLVTLLGYCQEDGSQILVYEYLPNDCVCSHLYVAGILGLLEKIEDAGPSSGTTNDNAFRDPEVEESRLLSEFGDVYIFGVFILELVSGQEVSRISFSDLVKA